MKTYYNEWDKYTAQWLRNLADSGEIAPGVVDERSIADVQADDLVGYDRCHFFAGIGGWDYALRFSRWPSEWPVWTGSCPCQPFSIAGKHQKGHDERHLWPEFFRLIRECKPPIVLMEQVAPRAGLAWLDVVFSDLETAGYSCGAVDLPACSVGAPHIRQRLWIVALAQYPSSLRRRGRSNGHDNERQWALQTKGRSTTGNVADSDSEGLEGRQGIRRNHEPQIQTFKQSSSTELNPWHSLHWLPCRDDKLRPTGTVESHLLSVADGVSAELGLVRAEGKTIISPLIKKTYARVGRLKGYGNAIVPQVAAVFISIVMEFING